MTDGPIPSTPHISVVIPVYRAEECLDELYKRLMAALESISSNFEIILVEDCGGDNSWKIIEKLAREDSRVHGIQFSRNFGQHYGITAGLDHSHGDWVVVMDCDLQERPEEIPRLYAKAQEGYDVILARCSKRRHPFLKRVASRLFYRLFSYLTDMDKDGGNSSMCIISRKVVVNFCLMREHLRVFGGLLHWMGFPTASVEIEHAQRPKGKSSYSLAKLLKLGFEGLIAYSDKPLRFAIQFGFLMASFAFCMGLYFLIRAKVYGVSVLGWSSIIVSMYFIGGIIIAFLGIIGIYLGKTFSESKKRPLYIINKVT